MADSLRIFHVLHWLGTVNSKVRIYSIYSGSEFVHMSQQQRLLVFYILFWMFTHVVFFLKYFFICPPSFFVFCQLLFVDSLLFFFCFIFIHCSSFAGTQSTCSPQQIYRRLHVDQKMENIKDTKV